MQSNQNNITQQQNIEQLQNATLGVETAIGNISQYSEQVSHHSQETDEELEKDSQIIPQTLDAINKIAAQVETPQRLSINSPVIPTQLPVFWMSLRVLPSRLTCWP